MVPGRSSCLVIVAVTHGEAFNFGLENGVDVVGSFTRAVNPPRIASRKPFKMSVAHHDVTRLAMARDQDWLLTGGVCDLADLFVQIIGCESAQVGLIEISMISIISMISTLASGQDELRVQTSAIADTRRP
jgi:hypothetical protein